MLYKKLNDANLWSKIQKLREIIKTIENFKQRKCWKCNRELNIYDFLSDNVEFSIEYLLKLWQSEIIQFHCCDCFKELKLKELERIDSKISTRYCGFCEKPIDIYQYSRYNNYLKISEIKSIWFDKRFKIFCDKICLRKYYKITGISKTSFKNNIKK